MLWPQEQRPKNEEVQSALWKVYMLNRHRLPVHFYKSRVYVNLL
jgi:hypothetical protein